jgi:hypothetical protein
MMGSEFLGEEVGFFSDMENLDYRIIIQGSKK